MQKNFGLVWRNPINNGKNANEKLSLTEDSKLVKRVIRNSNSVKHKSVVVRLPSTIIENQNLLYNFAENVELLASIGLKIIIVHEYSDILAKYLDLFEVNKKMDNFFPENSKLINLSESVISGYINKKIVSKLCSCGIMAVGFSGKDGNLLIAKKLNNIQKQDGLRHVSEPLLVNPELLFKIEDTNIIPVISPIACNEQNKTMILDADITSAMISTATSTDKLIIMCDNNFLLDQVTDISSISELNRIIENNLQITSNNSIIKALKYILSQSSASIKFIDSKKNDSLLLSILE